MSEINDTENNDAPKANGADTTDTTQNSSSKTATVTAVVKTDKNTRVLAPRPERIVSEEEIRSVGDKSKSTIEQITNRILAVQTSSESEIMGKKLNQLISEAQSLSPKKITQTTGIRGKLSQVLAFSGLSRFISKKRQSFLGRFSAISSRIDTIISEIDTNKQIQIDRIKDIESLAEANINYFHTLEDEITQLEALSVLVKQELDSTPEPTNAIEAAEMASIQNKSILIEQQISMKNEVKLLSMQSLPNLADQKDFTQSLVTTFNEIKEKMIPAYKLIFSQYLITIDQKNAVELTEKIRKVFNDSIKENATQMGKNAVQITKAKMSGMVDIDTLTFNQQKIIERIQMVTKTEDECLQKMREAKPKLKALEVALVKQYQKRPNDNIKQIRHQA